MLLFCFESVLLFCSNSPSWPSLVSVVTHYPSGRAPALARFRRPFFDTPAAPAPGFLAAFGRTASGFGAAAFLRFGLFFPASSSSLTRVLGTNTSASELGAIWLCTEATNSLAVRNAASLL